MLNDDVPNYYQRDSREQRELISCVRGKKNEIFPPTLHPLLLNIIPRNNDVKFGFTIENLSEGITPE